MGWGGRGEAREAEEQVPRPRPAEGRGLTSSGSPHISIPRVCWGISLGLGVSGGRESLLLSAHLLLSFRLRLWPPALPPHLAVLQSCSKAQPGRATHLLRRHQWLPTANRMQPHLWDPHSGCSPALQPATVDTQPRPSQCLCLACLPTWRKLPVPQGAAPRLLCLPQ